MLFAVARREAIATRREPPLLPLPLPSVAECRRVCSVVDDDDDDDEDEDACGATLSENSDGDVRCCCCCCC